MHFQTFCEVVEDDNSSAQSTEFILARQSKYKAIDTNRAAIGVRTSPHAPLEDHARAAVSDRRLPEPSCSAAVSPTLGSRRRIATPPHRCHRILEIFGASTRDDHRYRQSVDIGELESIDTQSSPMTSAGDSRATRQPSRVDPVSQHGQPVGLTGFKLISVRLRPVLNRSKGVLARFFALISDLESI
uniref:Uncharacterized protein n=1 Tax=Brassica campestris TaxID=3711 RepID=M4DXT5_BRACM